MRPVIAVVFGQSIEFVVVSPVAAKQMMDDVVAASHPHAVILLFLFRARQSSMLLKLPRVLFRDKQCNCKLLSERFA